MLALALIHVATVYSAYVPFSFHFATQIFGRNNKFLLYVTRCIIDLDV